MRGGPWSATFYLTENSYGRPTSLKLVTTLNAQSSLPRNFITSSPYRFKELRRDEHTADLLYY